MKKLFPLTVLALAGCGTGKSMTLDRPETLSTTTLPCGENELEHFRREYESCNKKAFSEIENNIDGSVKRPVNGNATCNAFDMLITECTKMLTFCFPDPQVQEAVEKQKNILKTTVELLLPDFEWDDCWNSLEKVSPSRKVDSSRATPEIVEETQQTETRAEETLTATTTTALPAPLAAASTTKPTTETATNALTEASSTPLATVETTTSPPKVTTTTKQAPRVIEVVEEILVPEQPKSSGASSAPEPEPSTESSAEKHRASALMACVVLAVSSIILT